MMQPAAKKVVHNRYYNLMQNNIWLNLALLPSIFCLLMISYCVIQSLPVNKSIGFDCFVLATGWSVRKADGSQIKPSDPPEQELSGLLLAVSRGLYNGEEVNVGIK